MAAWALHRKQRKLTAKDLRAFAITGLFCVPLAMVFYQLALVSGHANVVAVIFSGNPIFVTILAFLLLRESIRWNNILALVLEVLGILAIAVLGGGGGSLLSVVLAILAALFFALYAVLGKRETAQVGTIVVTCGSFLFGSVELLVLLLLGHTGPVSSFYGAVGLDMFQDVPLLQGINLQSLPYLLFIGIVSTGLGYVFQPSFGFLLGLIPAAWVIGRLAGEGTQARRIVPACLAGLGVLYLVGLPYMYLILNVYLDKGLSIWYVVRAGMLIYLPGDFLKIAVTTLLARPLKRALSH